MVEKPADSIQAPNQQAFKMRAAARYLGLHPQTLRKFVDEGKIPAKRAGTQRVFLLADLDGFLQALPQWKTEKEEEHGYEEQTKDSGRR